MNTIQIYLRGQRGRKIKLAADLGVSPGAISQWKDVPANRVLEVEQATGIPCHELRPDLYRDPKLQVTNSAKVDEANQMITSRPKRTAKSVLNDFPRITRAPGVMGGKPCIKGSRMTVGMIVAQIGDGVTVEELMDDFPELKREDIMEAIRYAGWLSGSMILELDSAA